MIIVFTFIIGGLFLIDMQTIHNSTQDLAINEARANFMKDQAFRLWVTSHGGLYVPTDDRTPPNPYLSNVPEQNITSPAGKNLTLMNPAYALRQLQEDYAVLAGV